MRKTVSTDEVKDFVLDYIRRNKIASGERLPSLRIIAAESGSSMPTVQRAIAMLISEGHLISKIGSGTFVAEKYDFSSNMVGVVSPHVDNNIGNFISDAIISIKETLQKAGYCPIVLEPPSGTWGQERAKEEMKLIKRFLELGICGLIVDASVPVDSPLWQKLKQLTVPVVCFNNCDNSHELNYVSTDNYAGGAIAARHFIERGHKKLAVIASNFSDTSSVVERIRGFNDELAKNGLKLDEDKFITMKSNTAVKSKNLESIKDLLTKDKDITGFFAVNDSLAIELMTICRNIGLSVPEEISFIGFDDSAICEHVNPRLTSINQASTRMGARTVEILLERINNPEEYQETTEIRLIPKLIVRDSVKDLKL
jgi:DNA-binding LacI/PurR family transcriptional regulator